MNCILGCRKAIYLQFEHKYDIAKFKDGEPKGLFAAFSDAPYYARNKDYIEKNVRDPTDFIVLDHTAMDQELLKKGVDTTAFWNIWRLTPEIYRTQDKEWIVKYDFDKLDDNLLADKADYVLSTTIDVFLAITTTKRMERLQDHGRHYLNLAKEGVPVYRKADNRSEVVATTPSGMKKVWTEFYVTGLDGSGHTGLSIIWKKTFGFVAISAMTMFPLKWGKKEVSGTNLPPAAATVSSQSSLQLNHPARCYAARNSLGVT